MDTSKLKVFAVNSRNWLLEKIQQKVIRVLAPNSLERFEQPHLVDLLEKSIEKEGKDAVIERVSYFWFNRLCAFRFMDVNGYTEEGIVSSSEPGQIQPDILRYDSVSNPNNHLTEDTRQEALNLINKNDSEAFELLLLSECDYWSSAMPFLFRKVNDYSSLLIPDNLLGKGGFLDLLQQALTKDDCKNVEVIGWLYQFYISEKKDKIYLKLGKGKKVETDEIGPVTQLFTPHWIVRYVVENTLGRLWMLNHPDSGLVKSMKYYIKPEEQEDFIKISDPAELRICDPACGSGHMLTYAFDLLYKIYEEDFISPAEAVQSILKNNLFGIEIDERAGELAAFALVMKARQKDVRFFNRSIEPNICVLKKPTIKEEELKELRLTLGFNKKNIDELSSLIEQFQPIDNLGSLIVPQCDEELRKAVIKVSDSDKAKDLSDKALFEEIACLVKQVKYLTQKHHVIVANPPYLAKRNMNGEMVSLLKKKYPGENSDLFSVFIERSFLMTEEKGFLGFMTPRVWMFISTYEKFRENIVDDKSLISLVFLDYSGFSEATVPICSFIIGNSKNQNLRGHYINLEGVKGSSNQAPKTLEAIKNPDCGWFFQINQVNFKQIPGSPIAFWVADKVFKIFEDYKPLDEIASLVVGVQTGDNKRFLRFWHEVSLDNICFDCCDITLTSQKQQKWFPYNKGGDRRKWYGNQVYVVNWKNDGKEIKSFKYSKEKRSIIRNPSFYLKKSISWGLITSGKASFRFYPEGFIFDAAGMSLFLSSQDDKGTTQERTLLGFLNSDLYDKLTSIINPTLNLQAGDVARLPSYLKKQPKPKAQDATENEDQQTSQAVEQQQDPTPVTTADFDQDEFSEHVEDCISIAKEDWDTSENSWNFTQSPLLAYKDLTFEEAIKKYGEYWQEKTTELQRLEEKINDSVGQFFDVQDEVSSSVSTKDITLFNNPDYKYARVAQGDVDVVKDFLSYAVGCIFGRYSPEKPGLILANANSTFEEYEKLLPDRKYSADDDGCVLLVTEYAHKDGTLAEKFKGFLKFTFGEENYRNNLSFIEQTLDCSVEEYFSKQFFKDHWKRYGGRPIYWLFSSPKGSFKALIYMHRYHPDTVGKLLRDYFTPYRSNIERNYQILASQQDGTLSAKDLKTKNLLGKQLVELNEYENEVLRPLVNKRISIDLDDGVLANYQLFGKALKNE